MVGERGSATRFLPVLALLALGSLAFLAIGALAYFSFNASNRQTLALDVFVWRIVQFTLWQASLSTLISIVLAIPVASILFENKSFAGRSILIGFFALPLALPQIVAVLAIVSLYGNQGFLTTGLASLGLNAPSIYGLAGILIAHVFFNLPLAVRILLGALSSMPAEYDRIAHQLSMGPVQRIRFIYWPYMRSAFFNAGALVFMLCVTSFTVVLTLGGGPRATTIEVAIYQALTFDFDVSRAVVLTLLQLVLTAFTVFVFSRAGGDLQAGLADITVRPMVMRNSLSFNAVCFVVLVLVAFFVASPFVAIVVKGLTADLLKLVGQTTVQRAILTSLVLGFCAAVLSVFVCLALCEGAVRGHSSMRWMYSQSASLILVVPPIVLAAGWFLLLRPLVNVYHAAPYIVVAVNAAMALPFALRFMLTARQVAYERHEKLCAQLGLVGFNKYRLVVLPAMRNSIFAAFAFAFALSLGDLGVIALFGSDTVQTLPHLILQRMGSYRTDDAAGLAFILCVLTLALMLLVDRSRRSLNHEGSDA